MRRTNRKLSIVSPFAFLFVLVGLTGCISSSAPKGWHPLANEIKTDNYGGWVEVYYTYKTGKKEIACKGELIAVHEDELLCLAADLMHRLDKEEIEYVKLMGYDSNYHSLVGWNVGGPFMALSNGWFAILEVPVFWLLIGPSAIGSHSRQPLVEYNKRRKTDWNDLRLYARFPQGLPEMQEYDTIRAKTLRH